MSRKGTALLILFFLLASSLFLKGYTYQYELKSSAFMSFSEMGYGIACGDVFRAYYQVDYDWNVKFISSYFPSEEDLKRFNDPYQLIEDFKSKAHPEHRVIDGNRTVLVLSREETGQWVNTHYNLRAVYEGKSLRSVSFSITHSLNYDPRNSTVIVDYVDVRKTYEVEETRCGIVLIGWFRPFLKSYLVHKLGHIPYPKPWDREPW